MSSDSQCLYSTPIDIPETLRSLSQQSSDSRLNRALTYVAQEVAERLQRSHHVPVNSNNNLVETIAKRCCVQPYGHENSEATLKESAQIAIRAIEPEYKFIITVEPLTERELEVLQLIVDGHNNSAIAGKLYIAVGTVKTHVRNILKKLGVSDRTQAAIWALRSGLVH